MSGCLLMVYCMLQHTGTSSLQTVVYVGDAMHEIGSCMLGLASKSQSNSQLSCSPSWCPVIGVCARPPYLSFLTQKLHPAGTFRHMSHLIGKPAPAFSGIRDQNGNTFDSASVIGRVPVVLFFYPQAMTMGCTKEACSLRDLSNGPTFSKEDQSPVMQIIGVSSDSVERQKQFADKHNLNYTLLADTEKKIREVYGVGGTALLGLAAQRVTFIIDSKGIIRATEDSAINMKAHTRLVEKWLPTIKGELQASQSSATPTSTPGAGTAPTATTTAPPPTAQATV